MSDTISTPGGEFLLEDAGPASVFVPEEFSPEARLMAATADDFLRKEVLTNTERIEEHDIELMRDLMRKAGALGLLGAEIPEAYGGLGVDNRTGALLAEKLNWQQSFALTHEAHTVIATLPLLYFGNHEQKARYLPKLASGEWIGSFCLSEPGSGSDALSAQTRASLDADGSHWVLNGTKMWITNAAFADLFTVFAQVDGDRFSAFLIERSFPGISFGREERKLGMRGTSTRRVILENVRAPGENLLGEVGKGHYAALCALNLGRFKLEAGAVGGLKETIAACARYAQERKQFGRPLASFGLVKAKLGEMAARTFALESSVYRLAGLLDGLFEGIDPEAADAPARYHRAAEEYAVECNVVKVVGSELYSWATDEAIQVHGGYGYTEEFPVARAWRDQRLLRIGEGANEVVRLAIVNTILRRAQVGRLPLDAAIDEAAGASAENPSPGFDTPTYSARLKTAALLLLGVARDRFGSDLAEEQEVCAAIADLVAAAYTVESAWMRSQKLTASDRGSDPARLAQEAAALYTNLAVQAVRPQAEFALARMGGPGEDESMRALGTLLAARAGGDVIGSRRRLADAALSRAGYPW